MDAMTETENLEKSAAHTCVDFPYDFCPACGRENRTNQHFQPKGTRLVIYQCCVPTREGSSFMGDSKKHAPKLCCVTESTEGDAQLVVSCSCGNTKQYHGEPLRAVHFVCDGLEIARRIPKAISTRTQYV
jgi:hypothetical protein